jgi:two-component system cell cycle response regulator
MYTILHLETSTLFKTLLMEISTEISAKYINTASAEEAMEILKREDISLILTAMELEEGNTSDFIMELNDSRFRNIPVVVITGNDTLDARKKMYELGIVDYILKKSGRDIIRQNLLSYRKDDTLTRKMKDLSYAVLDDNRMDRKVIERIFSMHGIMNAEYFEDEGEFFSSAQRFNVHLIDLVLKNTSGDRVIQKLREKDEESVVITISGIDNVKTISRMLSIGANDYITKPFNYDLFIARLKTNVRNYVLMQEIKVKTDLLVKMSISDPLTGLYNRRFINERFAQEAERFSRYGSAFSIIMFDIDRFKLINDEYGHQYGDIVIKKVSEVISSSIRDVDIAGRFGGEEFLVILPQTSTRGAVETADRIRKAVENVKFDAKDLKATISAGVVEYDGSDIEDMVRKADMLLYDAKEAGRNCVRF